MVPLVVRLVCIVKLVSVPNEVIFGCDAVDKVPARVVADSEFIPDKLFELSVAKVLLAIAVPGIMFALKFKLCAVAVTKVPANDKPLLMPLWSDRFTTPEVFNVPLVEPADVNAARVVIFGCDAVDNNP